ncbi:hypothetical protein Y032_0791g2371 [Ancylostoma ceylanicum]|uniref:Fatty acid synthase n=1 Tax=Ancylostoma ceylanicum TaxID=53326 RepID=A0A016WC87_9BILA|nr:hypothetical protein Y032_0791g2371 [Ancylostoma ceylanicum]
MLGKVLVRVRFSGDSRLNLRSGTRFLQTMIMKIAGSSAVNVTISSGRRRKIDDLTNLDSVKKMKMKRTRTRESIHHTRLERISRLFDIVGINYCHDNNGDEINADAIQKLFAGNSMTNKASSKNWQILNKTKKDDTRRTFQRKTPTVPASMVFPDDERDVVLYLPRGMEENSDGFECLGKMIVPLSSVKCRLDEKLSTQICNKLELRTNVSTPRPNATLRRSHSRTSQRLFVDDLSLPNSFRLQTHHDKQHPERATTTSAELLEVQDSDYKASILNGSHSSPPRLHAASQEMNPHHAENKFIETSIGIVAASCRLPGGVSDIHELWDLLKTGKNTSSRIPAHRIETRDELIEGTKYGSSVEGGNFLSQDISHFDSSFFDISVGEAETIDPQQRLLLECVHECFENAGIKEPSETGVFVGLMEKEYADLIKENTSILSLLGSMCSVIAGRINYVFGCHGPSVTVDTACSSSLVAIELAISALRSGRCSRAIVAGVNLILSEKGQGVRANGKMLSRHGMSLSFDARASGYGRSDGCVVVLLEKSNCNSNYLGFINGVNVNHGGRAASLTTPNPVAHKILLNSLIRECAPLDLQYWEAHGTGTAVGDPIETNALATTFQNLVVGSIKTVIGHGEASAGGAALVKLVLMLQASYIPPVIHFHVLNNRIDNGTLTIPIVGEDVPLKMCGMTSFGVSGTNSAAIVSVATKPIQSMGNIRKSNIFLISAKEKISLVRMVANIGNVLANTQNTMEEIAAAFALRKRHYIYRCAIIVDKRGRELYKAVGHKAGKNSSNRFALFLSNCTLSYDLLHFSSLLNSFTSLHYPFSDHDKLLISFIAFMTRLSEKTEIYAVTGRELVATLIALSSLPASHASAELLTLSDVKDVVTALKKFNITPANNENVHRTVAISNGTLQRLPHFRIVCDGSTVIDYYNVLVSCAQLYTSGFSYDFSQLFDYNLDLSSGVRTPTYSFNRRRMWFEEKRHIFDHYLLGTIHEITDQSTTFSNHIDKIRHPQFFNSNRIGLSSALEIAHTALRQHVQKTIVIEEILVDVQKLSGPCRLITTVRRLNKNFEVYSAVNNCRFFMCRGSTLDASESKIRPCGSPRTTKRIMLQNVSIPHLRNSVTTIAENLSESYVQSKCGESTYKGIIEMACKMKPGILLNRFIFFSSIPSRCRIVEAEFKSQNGVEVWNGGKVVMLAYESSSPNSQISPSNNHGENIPPTCKSVRKIVSKNKRRVSLVQSPPSITVIQKKVAEAIRLVLKQNFNNSYSTQQNFRDLAQNTISLVEFSYHLRKSFSDIRFTFADILKCRKITSISHFIASLYAEKRAESVGSITLTAILRTEKNRIKIKSKKEVSSTINKDSTSDGYTAMETPSDIHMILEVINDFLPEGFFHSKNAISLNFMELGLDSLRLVDFVNRLNEKYFPSLQLSTTDIFDYPTIQKLAEHIREKRSGRRNAQRIPQGERNVVSDEVLQKVIKATQDTVPQRFAVNNDTLSMGFMELGLDSLRLVDFVNRLNEKYFPSLQLSTTDIFDYPTIQKLAEHIREKRSGRRNAQRIPQGERNVVSDEVLQKVIKATQDTVPQRFAVNNDTLSMGFMELGLDSLRLVDFVNRLNEKYFPSLQLSTTDIFDYPTIQKLAEHIREKRSGRRNAQRIPQGERNVVSDEVLQKVIKATQDTVPQRFAVNNDTLSMGFMELGLDSLRLVDFVNRLNEKYFPSLQLSTTDIFDYPTIQKLAEHIREKRSGRRNAQRIPQGERNVVSDEVLQKVIKATQDTVPQRFAVNNDTLSMGFMELGLDSLRLVDFVNRLNEKYFPSLQLSTTDIFDYPTIQKLAEHIREKRSGRRNAQRIPQGERNVVSDEVLQKVIKATQDTVPQRFAVNNDTLSMGFMELGLDSLRLVDFVNRLNEKYFPSLQLSTTDIFDYPTIQKLAEHIREKRSGRRNAQRIPQGERNVVSDEVLQKVIKATQDTVPQRFAVNNDTLSMGFMELGLDSLRLVDFVNRLNEKYFPSLQLSTTDIFDYPTIQKLAEHIREKRSGRRNAQRIPQGERNVVSDEVLQKVIKATQDTVPQRFAVKNDTLSMGFMELGLDSLRLVDFVNRLNEKYFPSLQLSTTDIFDYPTIQKLAEHIREKRSGRRNAQRIPQGERNVVSDEVLQKVIKATQDTVPQRFAVNNDTLSMGFMELGLDSLRLVDFVNRLNEKYFPSLQLSTTDIFDYPTIQKLAEHISENRGHESRMQLPLLEMSYVDSPSDSEVIGAKTGVNVSSSTNNEQYVFSGKDKHSYHGFIVMSEEASVESDLLLSFFDTDILELTDLRNQRKLFLESKVSSDFRQLSGFVYDKSTITFNSNSMITASLLFSSLLFLSRQLLLLKSEVNLLVSDEPTLSNRLARSFFKTLSAEKFPRFRHIYAERLCELRVPAIRTISNLKRNWLITGGLTGIGFCIAKWLVKHCNTQNIVLVSRRSPNSELLTQIEYLRKSANVFVASSNVTDSTTLSRFFSRLPFKITGVIHNAGVLRDTIVECQCAETFTEVFSPKGDGFLVIEKLLSDYGHKLKHSIVMSSFTVVCGNAGQLNYAVSNAYLDHQIYLRRMEGRVGTTIHWGNWLETGMATGVRQNLRNYGFLGLTTKEALAFMAYAIKERPVELVAAKVNWPKLLRKRQDIRADIVVPLCHRNNSSIPEISKNVIVSRTKARQKARRIGVCSEKSSKKSDGKNHYHPRCKNGSRSLNNEAQYADVNTHEQNQVAESRIAGIPVTPSRRSSISPSVCDIFALNIFFNDEADFHTSITQNIDYLTNTGCHPLPSVWEKSQALHVTGTSIEEIARNLKYIVYEENARNLTSKTVMIFSGQGAQYPCMGMQLRKLFPVFKHHFERCLTMADEILNGGPPLLTIAENPVQAHLLQQTKYGQPVMFAYGFASAMLWRHLGFQPDFYLGHSVGELVAGVVTEIMTLEDGIRIVVERGLALEKIADRGALLAVDSRAVGEIIAKFHVSIASVNSMKQVVLAGKQDELMAVLTFIRSRDMQGTFVTARYPFHSSFIKEEDLADFKVVLQGIEFRKARTPIVSNVSGSLITTFSSEYLIKHVMSAVNTVECIRTLQHLNVKTWLEAGPTNTVVSFVRDTLERREIKEHAFLQTASERGQDVECVVYAALELEKRGVPIKWTSLYQCDVVNDPAYETFMLPLKCKGSFSETDCQILQNHHVNNENLIPGAYQSYILLDWINSKTEPGTYFTLDNTRFISPWKYEEGNEFELIQTHENNIHVVVKGNVKCSSKVLFNKQPFLPSFNLETFRKECTVDCDTEHFYNTMSVNGLDYRNQFRAIRSLKRSETRTYSVFEYKKPNAIWTLMDAAMHAVCLNVVERRPDVYFVPIHVGEIYLRQNVDPSSSQSVIALTELLQENEKFIQAHGCLYIDDTLVFQYKNKVSLVLNAPLAEHPGPDTKMTNQTKNSPTKDSELSTENGQTTKQATPIYILGSDGSFCCSAYDESEFWQQLKAGAAEEASHVRDFTSSNNAVMDIDIAAWDPEFFGITPKEAQYIDVLQRLMMQTVSKCLENAKLARIPKNTGIFIGVSGSDFTNRVYNEIKEQANGYYSSGTNGSCVAGRIAHWLKLEGPALVIDTACSSSFAALISAMDAMLSKRCEYAIVGGINIILHDTVTEVLRNAGMLSSKGVCQVFDAGADGYVRSEVVGCVLLSRYGMNAAFEIPRWAIRHNGGAAALQVPNGSSQERIMRHVCGEKVRDVECHGTGTSLGDPIEALAISKVHGPVTVSSVKSHIGHAEAASGIASLISCLLQMENNYRSNQKHFKCPNPRIDFRLLQVNTTGEERRLQNFAINNFGFSGTNCSITVKKLPHRQKVIDQLKEFVSWSDKEIGDICAILQKGRSAYRYRHCILYDNNRRIVWEYGWSPEISESAQFFEQTDFVCFEYGKGFCLHHFHQNVSLKNFLVNVIANLSAFEVPDLMTALQFHQFIGSKFVEGHFIKWSLYNLAPLNYSTNVPVYPFKTERFWPFNKQFARNFGTSSDPREDVYYEKSLIVAPKGARNAKIPVVNLGRVIGLKNIKYFSISVLQSSKLFNQNVIVLYHPYSSEIHEALELIALWQQLGSRENFVLLIARPDNGTSHSEWTALIRTLASEHQLPYKFVSYSKLRDLESEISDADLYECIFYRGPRRYVERLTTAKPNRIITSQAEHLLITGGTGGIGRRVIELMKPRKTTIVTRSGSSSMGVTKVPTETSFVKSDLCALKLPSDEHYDCVVHCAGVVDNALMGAMDTMRFKDVCLPKNVGLQTLREALHGMKPTRLVIASSAACILGSAGQANYAFANGMMTSLAEKFDMPTQIIHWGPLRDTGMLHGAHSEKIYEQLKSNGWNLLDPSNALNVLSTDAKNVLVFDGDFQLIVKSQPHLQKFLSKITNSPKTSRASEDASNQFTTNAVTHAHIKSEQPSLQRIIAEVSGIEDIQKHRFTPLMNLGIDSLMIEQIRSNINKQFRRQLTSREIYDNCSLDRLSKLVASTAKSKPQEIVTNLPRDEAPNQHTDIAIIAYSGAFSDCADVDQFWNHLLAGKDCISRNESEDDLVDAAGIIADINKFDHKFWNLTHEDASMLDPQLRVFLQTTYQALEKSGYVHQRNSLRIGVFAGAEPSEYGDPNAEAEGSLRRLFAMNMKDFVPTFTAHMLNLRGPAVGVYSACSTALLAITQACNSLRLSHVDLAVAGGISLVLPNQTRYVFQEGLVLSKTGTCRPFDKDADGTVRGSAVGCVVLKRLDQALRDNDRVEAVIKGYGLSNDGLHKASFMAPNCQGQYECIRDALSSLRADDVDRIAYVECHATGTRVGDEIEIDALKKAYKNSHHLTIGSVKANIGHGFAGSGMAGLFKTIRILQEQKIPPQINIVKPRTDIGFKVNTEVATLPADSMAAVSSFGIGGTNVHLILDKPPPAPEKHEQRATIHILPLSGSTAQACVAQCRAVANYLKGKSDAELGKVAATLQCRRDHLPHRVAVAVSSIPEAVLQLEAVSSPVLADDIDISNVCFFFSPQGVQYPNMAKASLNHADVFTEELFRLANVASKLFNVDFMNVMYPSDPNSDQISDAKYAQVALFIICRAVLAQMERWGVSSELLVGHSVGEYTAAWYAGMIDEYSCINLLKERGELVSQTAAARMLAVTGANVNFPDNVEVTALLSESLRCVVGSPDTIEALANRLDAEHVSFRELTTKHGFHSSMMDCIQDRFMEVLRNVQFSKGKKTIVSNIDGSKITKLSREYCCKHMRSPVNLRKCLDTVLSDKNVRVIVEIGPSGVLKHLLAERRSDVRVISTVLGRRKGKDLGKHSQLFQSIADLWTHGFKIDFAKSFPCSDFDPHLPTYQFEDTICWREKIGTEGLNYYATSWKIAGRIGSDRTHFHNQDVLVLSAEHNEFLDFDCKFCHVEVRKPSEVLEESFNDLARFSLIIYVLYKDISDITEPFLVSHTICAAIVAQKTQFIVISLTGDALHWTTIGPIREHHLGVERKNSFVDNSERVPLSSVIQSVLQTKEEVVLVTKKFLLSMVYAEAQPADPHISLGETVVVIGGTGAIGSTYVEVLRKTAGVRNIVVLGRTPNTTASVPGVSFFTMDVSEKNSMERVMDELYSRYGKIHTIIHSAGKATSKSLNKSLPNILPVLLPKVGGITNILEYLRCRGLTLDNLLMASSTSSVVALQGTEDYATANVFMDALALNGHSNVGRILSVQWPAWKSIGMASTYGQGELQSMIMRTAISPEAGKRIVRETLKFSGVIAPSPISLLEMRELVEKAQLVGETPRLRLDADEKLSLRDRVASVWREVLGIEVSEDSDFFESGGNSLSALRAVWSINMSLKTNITVDLLFRNPLFKDFIRAIPCERLSNSVDTFDSSSLADLTYSQENMFLLRQLERGTQYNILFTITFRSTTPHFAREKLVCSLHSLIARQHTLRTCFSQQRGSKVAHQMVLSLTESFQNLACTDVNLRENDRIIEEEQNFEFTLEEVPLRLRVNRVNGDYVVFFNQHHILTDGWSLTVLANELKNIYTLYSSPKKERPDPLPYSVSQYAHWQRRHVHFSKELEELKPLLSGREGTTLPQKLVVGTSNSFTKLFQILPESLTFCVKALAKKHHTTDFVVVLSAFVLTLRKFKANSQDDSIVIGCPVLGRNEKVKDLIGYFLNNTVVSLDVRPEQSLEDVVLMVKKTISESRRFESIPFHRLVAGLNGERRLNAHAIFQVFFNYRHELDFPTVAFPDAEIEIDQLSINKIFDLSFTFDETPEGSRAMVEFNSSKYRSETVRKLLNVLLSNLAQRSDSPTKNRQVHTDFPTKVLQSAMVLSQGVKCGLAIRRKDSLLLSCEEMHTRVSSVAESVTDSWIKLFGCSIRSDDIIAIELSPDDAIEAILAVHQIGAGYAPIDPLWPQLRKAKIMDNVGICFSITKDSLPCDPRKLQTRRVKFNRAAGSDIAYVIHTSGSTGSPKGVVLSHKNLNSFLRAATPQVLMRRGHRVSHSVNTVFDVSVMNIFGSFVNNCELCLHDDIRSSPFEIAEMRCDFAFLTSAVFNALTTEDMRRMSTLEKLFVGGETVNDRNLGEALKIGLDVTQIYGPTECTVWSLTNRCKTSQNEGTLIGVPVMNETCSIKFDMYEGELVLKGPKVARGYINAQNSSQFYMENGTPCYLTGDIVRLEEEGFFFRGRSDRQVKLRGHRIEIDEVERAILTSSPEVSEATILPLEKSILAFVVCTEPIDGGRIVTRLNKVLPSYMIPSSFIRVPNIPVNSSGKVDQNALLKEYKRIRNMRFEQLSRKARTTSSIEDVLLSIIHKLLSVADVTTEDSFFSVGGNSLLLFDLQKEISNSFAVSVEVHELFGYKTIAELAKLISSRKKEAISDTDTSMIIKLREANEGKLNVYLIHAIGGSIFPYHAFLHVLPKQINVYAIEYKLDFPANSLKELAAFYAKAVVVHTKNLPLFLMGHSMGGTISREMVEEMKQWDREVPFVIMFDTWTMTPEQLSVERVAAFAKRIFAHLPDAAQRVECAIRLAKMLKGHKMSYSSTKIYLFKSLDVGDKAFQEVIRPNLTTAMSRSITGNGLDRYSKFPINTWLVIVVTFIF